MGKGSNNNGYEYVDLGLPSGLKWAVYNDGSDEPTVGGKMIHEEKLSQKTSWGDNWRLPTKEEALAYSKGLAERQNGTLRVHASKGKSKGKIQKQ